MGSGWSFMAGVPARAWSALKGVFDDLGSLMGLGWDLSGGVLRHQGWDDLKRLQELVQRLPQLRELVQTLGRMQHSDSAPPVIETAAVVVAFSDSKTTSPLVTPLASKLVIFVLPVLVRFSPALPLTVTFVAEVATSVNES